MWHRSTDEGSVAGAPLLLASGVVVAVALAVLAAVVVYSGSRPKPRPSAVDAVRRAYLAYSAGLTQAYLELDPMPLRSMVTSEDLRQEESAIQHAAQSGFRYRLVLDHNLKVVVYSSRTLASVDDILVRHTTPLDAATRTPSGPASVDLVHESFGLVRQNQQWLVDSVASFGTGGTKPDVPISYAAVSQGKSPPPDVERAVDTAYMDYSKADAQALRTLSDDRLRAVEIEPLLTKDLAFLNSQRQKNQGYVVVVEHNYRIAPKDAASVWVYDSIDDSSYPIDLSSGQAIRQPTTQIVREAFEFKNVGNQWKLDYDEVEG